jgi:flagellar FliL protein
VSAIGKFIPKSGAECRIKSLVNREELRKECEAKVNELLVKETGKKAVRELIFTKYLYQ